MEMVFPLERGRLPNDCRGGFEAVGYGIRLDLAFGHDSRRRSHDAAQRFRDEPSRIMLGMDRLGEVLPRLPWRKTP